jgi:hypothetical protein
MSGISENDPSLFSVLTLKICMITLYQKNYSGLLSAIFLIVGHILQYPTVEQESGSAFGR